MKTVQVIGTGSYVPEHVVTNEALATRFGMDTTDEWIQRRTGIEERRFAGAGDSTSDLGLYAAKRALDAAGLDASALDLIVFATLSPDHCFPGSGVFLQEKLGLPQQGITVPCLDVRNQCSGFLYGLSTAVAHIRAGMANTVLVVGAEIHSAAIDLSTRGRAVASLFGDGAGAVVLQAGTDPTRDVQAVTLHADGRYAYALHQKIWDMSQRPYIAVPDGGSGDGIVPPEHLYAQMDGRLVFKHAVTRLSAAVEEQCRAQDVALDAIDLFVFHQANLRINQAIAAQLSIPLEKVPSNIERYGNTTAATLPILLDELVRDGRLKPGMRVLLGAFGSGFTWGTALMTW